MDPKPSSSGDPEPSSSSSGLSRRNYDAFLSFRGADCRTSFVSHLYSELLRCGVFTFLDRRELEYGSRRAELFGAIEGSRVAVVVFSKSYADSKWCLNELVKIMECRNQGRLTVIPIFDRVTPGEVRLHRKWNGMRGCYQIAMDKMEAEYGKDSMMVKNWRKSLREAGDLIGFSLSEGDDESRVVKNVVKEVLKELRRVRVHLHVAKHPVGIVRRLAELKPLLHLDPHDDDVYMVGIHGLGGVGKTTLSKAMCNDIAHEFDDWCFLPNVRETSKSLDGLVHLQQKLLQDLVSKDLIVSSVHLGKILIRERLCKKRVLLVLDDVDDLDQFDALAGSYDWFGKGSRIVITTRDSHLLAPDRVQHIHEVGLLEATDADDLFQRHAFAGLLGNMDIDRSLIDRFLRYADGLPLALAVLGSFLCGRSKSQWESALKLLDKEPVKGINSVLMISFLGLESQAQEIFLDLACFFKGWDEEYVMKVLDSCGFEALINKQILVERCLLTIEDGKFQMHDLLEVMGKSIVRVEGGGIPSRIWKYDDFHQVLSENAENEAVKGIVLDLAGKEDELITPTTFKGFKRARLLILRNACSYEGFLYLPRQLRWFAWPGYSGPTIGLGFPVKLVGLDLREMVNLRFLEKLILDQTCIEELPDSVSNIIGVKYLSFANCRNLTDIPSSIYKLQGLQTLIMNGCSRLSQFPRKPVENTSGLRGFPDLVSLELEGCNLKEVEFLRDLTCFLTLVKILLSGNDFSSIPDCLKQFRNLKELSLCSCRHLVEVPPLPGILKLSLKGCSKLTTLPSLHTFICSNEETFEADLSHCDLLDPTFIRRSLQFEVLQIFPRLAFRNNLRPPFKLVDVIASGEMVPSGIPNWKSFGTTIPDDLFYQVAVPQDMAKFDKFGLMLLLGFKSSSTPVTMSLASEKFLIQRSATCVCNDLHTWVVLLPLQSVYCREFPWNDRSKANIVFRIKSQEASFQSITLKIICEEEEDSQKFVFQLMESQNDQSYDRASNEGVNISDDGSISSNGNEVSTPFKKMVDKIFRRKRL